MKKTEIREFFDRLAPRWDETTVRNEKVIEYILDCGGIRAGAHVLDVACGTGVLFPDYFARNVGSLTAVDISPEMTKIAKEKYPAAEVICADAEKTAFSRDFDAIMVYNAFPHFPSPEGLVSALCSHLKRGGRLTVAHGMSRRALEEHHSGSAAAVSIDLLPENELAAIFGKYLEVDTVISDEEKYIVSGVLR